MHGKIDKISIDRLKLAFVEEPNNNKARENEIAAEDPAVILAQPLKKRGRPSREELERRAQEQTEREREREKTPTFATRSGRVSRPPCRL